MDKARPGLGDVQSGKTSTYTALIFNAAVASHRQAMPESKREANGKVVEMVLKPLKASAYSADFLIGSKWE